MSSSPTHADDPAEVVIGIETDRGLWVQALVAAGYQVYAINPLAVARYRDRHNVVGREVRCGRREGARRSGPHRPPQPSSDRG